MRIIGLVFVGTRTDARAQMAGFARDVLGLTPAQVSGVDADLFELPDGSSFAVGDAANSPGDGDRANRQQSTFISYAIDMPLRVPLLAADGVVWAWRSGWRRLVSARRQARAGEGLLRLWPGRDS